MCLTQMGIPPNHPKHALPKWEAHIIPPNVSSQMEVPPNYTKCVLPLKWNPTKLHHGLEVNSLPWDYNSNTQHTELWCQLSLSDP